MGLGRLVPPIGAGTLLTGFRTQGYVGHQQNYWGWSRQMQRPAYVRDTPGQVQMIQRSAFQPMAQPAKVQVDIVQEYMRPWPMLGYVGYLERTPYIQGQKGQSVLQPRPQFPYTVQPPRWSTLPQIFGVGGG